jgi:NTP pyrophosphatase (non-canonical NTP hydrolase)
MFIEGSAVHSAAYLQQVAAEFQAGHWVRVAAGATTAVLAFVAMLRMHAISVSSSAACQWADPFWKARPVDLRELVSQVEHVSQAYAARFGITRDSDWQILKLHEEVGELTQAHLMRQGQARSKGLSTAEIDAVFRAEVADVLGQVLLIAHHHGIDVVEEIERKWLVRRNPAALPD